MAFDAGNERHEHNEQAQERHPDNCCEPGEKVFTVDLLRRVARMIDMSMTSIFSCGNVGVDYEQRISCCFRYGGFDGSSVVNILRCGDIAIN